MASSKILCIKMLKETRQTYMNLENNVVLRVGTHLSRSFARALGILLGNRNPDAWRLIALLVFLWAQVRVFLESLVNHVTMPHCLNHTVHETVQSVWTIRQLEVKQRVFNFTTGCCAHNTLVIWRSLADCCTVHGMNSCFAGLVSEGWIFLHLINTIFLVA